MITSVHVQNFKNLRDQTITLDRFTVFVGANGSGKTSVLDAIHLAIRAAVGDPSTPVMRGPAADRLSGLHGGAVRQAGFCQPPALR